MKHYRYLLFPVIAMIMILSFTVHTTMAQKLKSGPQDLCFFSSVDETDQPYAVYIPKNFDENRKYPLVVFLHGAWSNHRLGLRRVFGQGNIQGKDFMTPGFVPIETDLESTRYWPELKDVDYIAAAPYARGTAGYQGIPEQDVYEMLDDLQQRFPIDEDRIYLTGLSMGGGGTIWLGLTRPDTWAAIAPVCPAPPEESSELAGNVLNLPVHLFIGDKDFLYQIAQDWKKKFETCSKHFDYIEYPGINHNSWEYAYKDGFIFEWFSQFERNRFPEQVKFSTKWYKYDGAYWVKFDKITPGTLATIDASFNEENQVEVTTSGLDAFTLNLTGHPKFIPEQQLKVILDGKSFRINTPDVASFKKENDAWVNEKYTPGLMAKQPGAEGPINAAVSSNHVYVYGTGGNPTPDELQIRRAQAAAAADWVADRGMFGRIMVFPRVISDREIRQSDLETSNLILFGTRETNSIIERFADKLPMHLHADASEYGLVYIFPLNQHYVLVNSGLPWWAPKKPVGGNSGQTGGFAFLQSKIDALKNFQDFVLFNEFSDNVISEGYFDENWELPATESAKIKSTGVVSIND